MLVGLVLPSVLVQSVLGWRQVVQERQARPKVPPFATCNVRYCLARDGAACLSPALQEAAHQPSSLRNCFALPFTYVPPPKTVVAAPPFSPSPGEPPRIYEGTLVGVKAKDPKMDVMPWESLLVEWDDEPGMNTVNPWEVEAVSAATAAARRRAPGSLAAQQ